jgi:predicted transcriptional regulator
MKNGEMKDSEQKFKEGIEVHKSYLIGDVK